MSESVEAYRYEIKSVHDAFAAARLEAELRLHPAGCRELHPPRRVQSVYFDSHDDRALRDNLAGISDREKVRLRWYGDATDGVRARLERKVRHNAIGRKDVFELPAPIAVAGADRAALVATVRAACPPAWRAWFDGLGPSQWVAYRRAYLTTFDRRVRITIDREVTTVDLRGQRRLDPRRGLVRHAGIAIVELKAPVDRAEAIAEFLQECPWTIGKSSKFVLAGAPGHYG